MAMQPPYVELDLGGESETNDNQAYNYYNQAN